MSIFSVFAVKLIKPAVAARSVSEIFVLLKISEKAANSPGPKSLLVEPTQSSKKMYLIPSFNQTSKDITKQNSCSFVH